MRSCDGINNRILWDGLTNVPNNAITVVYLEERQGFLLESSAKVHEILQQTLINIKSKFVWNLEVSSLCRFFETDCFLKNTLERTLLFDF